MLFSKLNLFILSLFLMQSIFLFCSPLAEANYCKNINNKLVCINKINRSAKNYWEYKVSLKIDNIITPFEVYNCRQKYKINKDKTITPFLKENIGEWICSLFQK